MKVKSIRQLKKFQGKKVLLRVDFNVSLGANHRVDKAEDYRIVKTLPTIKFLTSRGARVIIMAHLGRPHGKIVENLRLKPVAEKLSELLKKKVLYSKTVLGAETKQLIKQMKAGDVLMLENLRFDIREERGDKNFARQLAELGDIYINEAFADNHRHHASTAIIQDYLPAYAGLLLEQEILNLTKVLKKPKQPLVVIIGGTKMETKIRVIKNFSKVAKKILLGGALANTVLHVMGVSVGRSPVEKSMFSEVKKFKLTANQIVVPLDGVMAAKIDSQKGRMDALADVRDNELILDVGPDTIKLYEKIIKSAKMVMWNGPMGLIENPVFAKGTQALIKILANSCAETIVGGGETVQMIRQMKLENKFNFVSTGGGAMLEFLEGKKLPGLKKLIKNL
ncbi:MAG: phosphoglycerate kinase [Patescibacteria group bacterium]